MNCKRIAAIATLTLFLFMGCSGNNANIKNLSESESKAIQQELLDNWLDYDISYNTTILVFDPKNDDKEIIVDNYWSTVKDQATWTQIVNGTVTLPNRSTNRVWGNPIREIWVYNQFYGYVIHHQEGYFAQDLVSAMVVDDNAVQLYTHW